MMVDDSQYRKGPNDRINQVRLSEALQSKLRKVADRDDRSLSYVIRKACEEFALKDDFEEMSLKDSLELQERNPKPRRSDRETPSD